MEKTSTEQLLDEFRKVTGLYQIGNRLGYLNIFVVIVD
jgi:hypothetical protein